MLFLFSMALGLATAALAGVNRGGGKRTARAAGRIVREAGGVAPEMRCPLPKRFRPAFENASTKTGVPLSVLVAMAEVESSFEPDAISNAGARGLLQVLPSTARELRIDLDDPGSDVLAGARYLRGLNDRFDSLELALAAYNAGPTAVARAGGAPSEETREYVDRVMERWQKLAGCT